MRARYSIRITEDDFNKCRSILLSDLPKESATFLMSGIKTVGNHKELIVRRLIEIAKSEYRIQDNYHLDISPKAINGLIALCEANGLSAILCHSHPSDSLYSSSDDFGEKRIAKTLWQFLPNRPVGSLLFSSGKIRGRIWDPHQAPMEVATLTIVGRHLKKVKLNRLSEDNDIFNCDIFNRQILAFGSRGQEMISDTKVGIVGLGGTGSPTAEQLVRKGVRDFTIIDHDDFDPSNLSRMYGSTYRDAYPQWYKRFPWKKGRPSKVHIISRNLKQINPNIQIRKVKSDVVKKNGVIDLLDRDIVFCCTDNHWSRSILNQVAYQYLIPVINMGVRIDTDNGNIKTAAGAVHVLRPGKPCLWCYEFLRAERIRAESLPIDERNTLLREGYVENIDTSTPSVVPLTTTIAGLAVTQFLQFVTDFMGHAGDLSCLIYDIMTPELRRGTTNIKKECVCQTKKGYGDLKPLPVIN
jgi:molybdopterin/thiamine biosynthesis adenylyltransferase